MSSIVVFNPNKRYLGALFVQIPFFHHVRHYYPEARITLFSRNKESKLLLDLGLADELILYANSRSILRIWGQIWHLRPNLGFNLKPNSDLINLALWLSPVKRVYGYGESIFSRMVLAAWVKNDNQIYKASNYLQLFALDNPLLADQYSWFKQQAEGSELACDTHKTNICFIPGGGQEGKRWGIENYLKCAALFLERFPDAHLVFVMGSDEQVYLPFIEKTLLPQQYTILLNRDIATICKAIRQCKLTISNDCGPSHLAQMLGGAYLGIWGYARRKSLSGRIAEWSIPKDNSLQTAAPGNDHITTLPAAAVFQKALTLL